MSDPALHLLVWDSDGVPPSEYAVCSWNGYSGSGQICYLFSEVDEHADAIRDQYVSWIDEVGQSSVGRRRVVDWLRVGGTGFSVWWMTSLFEKSFVDAPTMARIARVLALDAILNERKPSKVTVVSDLPEVRQSIRRLCRRRGITCRTRRAGKEDIRVRLRRLIGLLVPSPLRAAWAVLHYFVQSRPARGVRPAKWYSGSDSILMISCFGQMTSEEAKAGKFETRYWTGLREVLSGEGLTPNWLHYFVPSPTVPHMTRAAGLLTDIDARSDHREAHALLESYLTPRAVIRVVIRWLRLAPCTVALRALGGRSFGSSTHQVLWPLVRQQWRDDARGARSVHNLIWVGLFDDACADLPRQNRGIFPCEGTSWEHAFIHAWRTHGHGELIGVPHATVHHWDVRYLNYAQGRGELGELALRKPDRLVRNNVTAGTAFKVMGLAPESIVDCESLRYNYLLGLPRPSRVGRSGSPRVLVLGEMRRSATERMLAQMAEAVGRLDISITLKPHPSSPVDLERCPLPGLKTVDRPLVEVLPDFDLVVASHATAAGIEAYLAGLRLVIWLDADDLNLSDLRGVAGVKFVGGPEELRAGLTYAARPTTDPPGPSEFFCLDGDLSRWRKLLSDRVG